MKIPPGLFGKPTETEIYVDGILTPTLLDTGSTVSTISETFYREHISAPLNMIDSLLDIECADGQQLPYSGYTEVELQLLGLPNTHPCILLVTPDSRYHNQVPLLLGTNALHNIMDTFKEQHGERYLQNTNGT